MISHLLLISFVILTFIFPTFAGFCMQSDDFDTHPKPVASIHSDGDSIIHTDSEGDRTEPMSEGGSCYATPQERIDLTAVLEEKEEIIHDLTAKVADLKTQIINLKDDADDLNTRLDEAEQDLDTAENARDEAITESIRAKKELEKIIKTSEERKQKRKKRIEELKEEIEVLKKDLAKAENKKDKFSSHLSKVMAERNVLQAQLKEMQEALSQKPTPNIGLLAAIDQLEKQTHDQKREIARLSRLHQEALQKNVNSTQKLELAQSDMATLKENHEKAIAKAIEETQKSYKSQIQGLSRKISGFEDAMALEKKEKQGLLHQIHEKEQQIARVRKENEALKAKAQTLHEMDPRHQEEMKSLTGKLSRAEKEIAHQQAALDIMAKRDELRLLIDQLQAGSADHQQPDLSSDEILKAIVQFQQATGKPSLFIGNDALDPFLPAVQYKQILKAVYAFHVHSAKEATKARQEAQQAWAENERLKAELEHLRQAASHAQSEEH
jgi:septal ring factor EnvC (AmiA/AmiB activator)